MPECSGSWIIYGASGNGKTTFSLLLMKYLCEFKKCAYLSLEEGEKLSFQMAVQRAGLDTIGSKAVLWFNYDFNLLINELESPRSPKVVFIDSVQYFFNSETNRGLTKNEYKELIRRFPTKLFIFISHEKNGMPKGALADAIYYDSDVCLRVRNFEALPAKSRYGGNQPLKITL